MKKCIVIACMLVAVTGYAQKKSGKELAIPAQAKAAFQKTYPTAADVKWEKEGGDYEVNFKDGMKVMSAVYDQAGKLKETEEAIPLSELPANATAYIKQHHPKVVIKDAAKITKANGEINYEAGTGKVDLIFDKSGKYLRSMKD